MASISVGPFRLQRMNWLLAVGAGGVPEPVAPVINLSIVQEVVKEGSRGQCRVTRVGELSLELKYTYSVVSSLDPADLTGTLTAQRAIAPGVDHDDFFFDTVNRAGLQGTRQAVITISDPISCTIGQSTVRSDIADVVPVTDPLTFDFKPSTDILPALDSDIVVWNIPVTGGSAPIGSPGKALWAKAPNAPVTGFIDFGFTQFDTIVCIGLTVRGTSSMQAATAVGGPLFNGMNIMQVKRPAGMAKKLTFWLSNFLYLNDRDPPMKYGDLIRCGTAPNADKSNGDEGMILYIQNVKIPEGMGHYGWTDPRPGVDDKAPHSDCIQPRAGWVAQAWLSRWDAAWHYQSIFIQGSDIVAGHCSLDGEVHWSKMYFRHMPPDFNVYPSTGTRKLLYTNLMGGADATGLLNAGDYYSLQIHGDVYAQYNPANDADRSATQENYFAPRSVPSGPQPRFVGNRCILPPFISTAASPRQHKPVYVGAGGVGGPDAYVDFTPPPFDVCPDSIVGYAITPADKTALRAIFAIPDASRWWDAANWGTPRSARANGRRIGGSYFGAGSNALANFKTMASTTGLPDGWTGGRPNSADATMATITGGSYATANNVIAANSALDWSNPECHWTQGWHTLPAGSIAVWAVNLWGADRHTWSPSSNDYTILDEIIAGTWDVAYANMAKRIVKNYDTPSLNPRGHLPKHLLLRMIHEWNQSNYYAVLGATGVAKLKTAMTRVINVMKANFGAYANDIKFMWSPAHRSDTAAANVYLDACPDNIDVVSVSWHPTNNCDTPTEMDKYNNGTDSGNTIGLAQMLAASVSLSASQGKPIPMCLPEAGPKYEAGVGCPIADVAWDKLNDFITANEDMMLITNIYDIHCYQINGYLDTQAGAAQKWRDALNNILKVKYIGTTGVGP